MPIQAILNAVSRQISFFLFIVNLLNYKLTCPIRTAHDRNEIAPLQLQADPAQRMHCGERHPVLFAQPKRSIAPVTSGTSLPDVILERTGCFCSRKEQLLSQRTALAQKGQTNCRLNYSATAAKRTIDLY
jgi:hypothetical protein